MIRPCRGAADLVRRSRCCADRDARRVMPSHNHAYLASTMNVGKDCDVQASKPSTQTIAISDVKDAIVHLVVQVSHGETRIVVENGGVPIAAIVSSDDLKHLARLDEQRAERKRVVAAMREPFRGVSPEEIERETAMAAAEVREEMRDERESAATRR